jgi:3-hydroxyacyl-CoA dehydrogenase
VGLPEVNIGLLPGAQGTQRLPRLIGAENALSLMLSGDHVSAKDALKMGVVDKVVREGDNFLETAIAFCLDKVSGGSVLQRISKIPPPQGTDFDKWRSQMSKRRPGEPAPHAIIRCVQAACKGPNFSDGVVVEQKNFLPLISSPESKALRHVFFAERNGAKVDSLRAKPRPIRSVGIVGAGLMGGGIAMCCANVGIKVYLLDVNSKGLERGMKLIIANYKRSRSMSGEAKERALANITPTTDYDDFCSVDLVVEAVFEDMSVKKKIFQTLNKVCKKDSFLCSNTSALDIDEIADQLDDPTRCMGTHFFSPANVMKLLENVRATRTSDECVASMMKWGKQIGKWVILVGNCAGFVGNRMVGLYGGQARVMLEEGAYPKDVDGAAKSFGMRMGPLSLSDIVGLDLGVQAVKNAGLWKPETNLQHALVEAKRLGQKASAGFYDYDGKRNQTPSPNVRKMIDDMFSANGRRALGKEEMQNRLFFPLINEGFHILEGGFARRPADIDVCYIHGYNFPRYRGGPMFHADAVGLPLVKSTLEKIGVRVAPLLDACIDANMSLQQYWSKHGKEVLERAGPPRRRGQPRSRM